MADCSHTALIVVDSQIGALSSPTNFWGPSRSTPSYESSISKLLLSFRSLPKSPSAPHIIHIYHSSTNPLSPLHPSSPGMDFHACSLPQANEPVFSKSTNSAFIRLPTPEPEPELELEKYLREKEIWKIYFVGLSVDLCLGSTVRSASDLGVADHVDAEGRVVKGDLVVVEDAVAAWAKHGGKFDAETVCAVHLESLKGEFARVVRVADILAEMGLEELE